MSIIQKKGKGAFFTLALITAVMALSAGCVTEMGYYSRETQVNIPGHREGIPAWLLAGLDGLQGDEQKDFDVVTWYAEARSRGLPPLGDQWFIPGFIDDPLNRYVEAVARTFVRYLSEIEELQSLISLYHRDTKPWYFAESWNVAQAWEAEQVRAKLWAEFVGADVNVQEVIFQYTFGDSMMLTPLGYIDIEFNALARYGWFFFTSSGWPGDIAEHFIEAGEESIRFIGDWLGYRPNEPLISVFMAPPHDFGIAAFGGGGRYWADAGLHRTIDSRGPMGEAFVLSVHAHEAAHALLALGPINRSNIPTTPEAEEFMSENAFWGEFEFGQLAFEEGFCVLFQHLFLIYTENDRFAIEYAQTVFSDLAALDIDSHVDIRLHEQPFYIAYNTAGGFETFEEFAAFMDEFFLGYVDAAEEITAYLPPARRASREEIITRAHFQAYRVLTMGWNMFGHSYDFLGALQAGVPNAALFDHFTAASFFLYLLENRGTRADFLRVYQDIYQMTEVYGIDLESMIAQWRVYLNERFEEWARAMEAMAADEGIIWQNDFSERYFEWLMQWFEQMQESN